MTIRKDATSIPSSDPITTLRSSNDDLKSNTSTNSNDKKAPSTRLSALKVEHADLKDPEKLPSEVQSTSYSDEDPGPGAFAHLDLKAIHRKMDFRIVPMLTVLYLLSFLDRGNIGNANIEGLSVDLNLTGAQYNWCLTAFFFTYAAFEVPSNMVLKKLRPRIWLPSEFVVDLVQNGFRLMSSD
jgi:hypothetical protein